MVNSTARAKRVIDARIYAPETAGKVEEAAARELLSGETMARESVVRPLTHPDQRALSPMEATEAFAKALEHALTAHAVAVGGKGPKRWKYDPLFSTNALFREVWRARQIVDELGIPYDFYCSSAVTFYWMNPSNKRNPRPSRLLEPDIREAVMRNWASLQNAGRRLRDRVTASSPVADPIVHAAMAGEGRRPVSSSKDH